MTRGGTDTFLAHGLSQPECVLVVDCCVYTVVDVASLLGRVKGLLCTRSSFIKYT